MCLWKVIGFDNAALYVQAVSAASAVIKATKQENADRRLRARRAKVEFDAPQRFEVHDVHFVNYGKVLR